MDAPMSDAPAVTPPNVNDPALVGDPPTANDPATATAVPAAQDSSTVADPDRGPSRKKAKKSHAGDSTAAKLVAPST